MGGLACHSVGVSKRSLEPNQLGRFLRARRQALSPDEVGLPEGQRRRTLGLRREEVAALSGVSVTWLTWLEQGRNVQPSREVLEAISRALRLSEIEHDHLLRLAGRSSEAAAQIAADSGRPLVRSLLDCLAPAPAYALDNSWTITAWNEPMVRLFPPLGHLDGVELNLLHIMFLNEDARRLIGDWESEARRVLAQFRVEFDLVAARSPTGNDSDLMALVADLRASSALFAQWWDEHVVDALDSHVRVFHHPSDGRLEFNSALLREAGLSGMRFVVHLPL